MKRASDDFIARPLSIVKPECGMKTATSKMLSRRSAATTRGAARQKGPR
jgi:hypothetical protein